MKTYDALLAERDAAMREASELAMSIWRAEFQQSSPNFELCDSPAGVISQIDNMYAGIRSQRDALASQVGALEKWRNLAIQFDGHRMQAMGLLKMVATGHFDIRVIQKFVAAAPVSGCEHLAEIKAQAIKDFVKSLPSYAHDYDVDERLEKQASQYAAKIINGEIK